MKVHHVGYAVKCIEESLPYFSALGYETCSEVFNDNIRNVKILFLQNGSEKIELVAPNGESTPVDEPLRKTGAAPYHICYEVENLEEVIKALGRKWLLIKKPEIAPAIENRRVAFLYQNKLGLIELVES